MPSATAVIPSKPHRKREIREICHFGDKLYVGLEPSPDWLAGKTLLEASGGRDAAERRRVFEEYHQAPLREGRLERVWDRVVAGAVLGSERFVAEVRAAWSQRSIEEVRSGEFAGGIPWERIVEAVEAVHGGRWEQFRDRHGDWWRDVALYLGRQRGRLKLGELARLAAGVGYTAVAQALRRVRERIDRDNDWRRRIEGVTERLSTVKV